MQRVTCQFGEISFTTQSIRVSQSPTEENELLALIIDPPHEIRDYFLHTTPIPKGKVSITQLVRCNPQCPNCGYELSVLGGNYQIKEVDTFHYDGVSVQVLQSYEEHILELKLKYETVKHGE